MPSIKKKTGKASAPVVDAPAIMRTSAGAGVTGSRLKRIDPSALDALVSHGRGTGGSSFGKLQKALTAAGQANDTERAGLLGEVDRRATAWLNSHDPRGDSPRHDAVRTLLDELPAERAALSKYQADHAYASGFERGAARFKTLAEPAKMYDFKPELTESVDEYGLTRAEVLAIRTFTKQDYAYINPATANSPSWLDANKKNADFKVQLQERELDPDDQLRRDELTAKRIKTKGIKQRDAIDEELHTIDLGRKVRQDFVTEGATHAAMALQGLNKLPDYDGAVFRGAGYTETEFAAAFKQGGTLNISALTSYSKSRDIATSFAGRQPKSVKVLTRIEDAGGRDISAISTLKREAEVVLLPGSSYKVRSIKKMPRQDGHGFRDTWYEVVMRPSRG